MTDGAIETVAARASQEEIRLLAAALDALEADKVMMDALGPLRSTAYLAVKRSEAAHFQHSTDPYYECFQHFAKI
jgi:glutamine synthetase